MNGASRVPKYVLRYLFDNFLPCLCWDEMKDLTRSASQHRHLFFSLIPISLTVILIFAFHGHVKGTA